MIGSLAASRGGRTCLAEADMGGHPCKAPGNAGTNRPHTNLRPGGAEIDIETRSNPIAASDDPAEWPSAADYVSIMRNPGDHLMAASIDGAEPRQNTLLRQPWSASGRFAIVFDCSSPSGRFALRCFSVHPGRAYERYEGILDHLDTNGVTAIADTSWVDDAVRIRGGLWPALRMEWVEGDLLHRHIEAHLGDRTHLEDLAERWTEVCRSLRDADVAHGDLSAQNVIVQPDGAIRLIDLDGMWTPTVVGIPSRERGHPAYQHPRRAGPHWNRWIDSFSALTIYTSIRALAADPGLWDHHDGENLVLDRAAFEGDTERDGLWDQLLRNPDPRVVELVELLRDYADADEPLNTDLAEMLDSGQLSTRATDHPDDPVRKVENAPLAIAPLVEAPATDVRFTRHDVVAAAATAVVVIALLLTLLLR